MFLKANHAVDSWTGKLNCRREIRHTTILEETYLETEVAKVVLRNAEGTTANTTAAQCDKFDWASLTAIIAAWQAMASFSSSTKAYNVKTSVLAAPVQQSTAPIMPVKPILTIWRYTQPLQQQPAEMQSVIRAVTPEAIALCRAASSATRCAARTEYPVFQLAEKCAWWWRLVARRTPDIAFQRRHYSRRWKHSTATLTAAIRDTVNVVIIASSSINISISTSTVNIRQHSVTAALYRQ